MIFMIKSAPVFFFNRFHILAVFHNSDNAEDILYWFAFHKQLSADSVAMMYSIIPLSNSNVEAISKQAKFEHNKMIYILC